MYRPEQNILRKAGSSLGFVHSEETIAKLKEISKNRIYSEERKAKLAALNKNRSKEFQEKRYAQLLKLNLSKGHCIRVINVLTNKTTIYSSIRQTVLELNTSHTTIKRYLESKKLFK